MFWVLATVALNVGAQISLKAGTTVKTGILSFVSPLSVLALALYGAGFATWIMALRSLPVSVAYPFMSLTTLLVPILGYFILEERLTVLQWVFLLLIFLSVVGFAFAGDNYAL